jgi:DNA-binding NarL/FixJ family response regulator
MSECPWPYLSVRAWHVLIAAQVETPEQLRDWAATRTARSLQDARNVGVKTMGEIVAIVAEAGGQFLPEHSVPKPYSRRELPSEVAARQRRQNVLALRASGKTYRQIGAEVGVGPERIRQLLAVAARRGEVTA